jgi:hypothetical protein
VVVGVAQRFWATGLEGCLELNVKTLSHRWEDLVSAGLYLERTPGSPRRSGWRPLEGWPRMETLESPPVICEWPRKRGRPAPRSAA